MTIKIVAISDTHGELPVIPPCDLLLIAGDICPVFNHSVHFQANWLNFNFKDWIAQTPAKNRVVVAGNHDFVFQQQAGLIHKTEHYHYLQDSGVELEGLKIWGTPWQPPFFDWAFNLREEELAKRWELIPEDTDILVTHGPPRGYGDKAPRQYAAVLPKYNAPSFERVGSPSLLERIKVIKPKLVVYGHIHPDRGIRKLEETILANVCMVSDSNYDHHLSRYIALHEPTEFELDITADSQLPRS